MNTVTINNVTKRFNETVAVNDLTLTVPAGTIFGLLGPNGAGKTTMIRMIMDIFRPDEGEIRILGESPGTFIQSRVGYLPEERGLYRKMKVIEQILFLSSLKGFSGPRAREKALETLKRYDLDGWAEKKVETLSKGMQQKVQFIATILHDPDLLILDEPFSGLDPVNQALLKEEIQSFVERGKCVIFSTHVLPQAEQLCRHICLINEGRKVLDGDVSDIKAEFSEPLYNLVTPADPEDLLLDGVVVTPKDDHIKVRLGEIAPGAYLKAILDRGLPVTAFSPEEIDLETIFIKVVNHDD